MRALTNDLGHAMMGVLGYTDSEAFFVSQSRHTQSDIVSKSPPIRGTKRLAVCLSNDGN